MIKIIGLLATALIGIRFLSDRIITVDVNGGASTLRDIGGYVLNGNNSDNLSGRLRVPYDPNTGRINFNQDQGGGR